MSEEVSVDIDNVTANVDVASMCVDEMPECVECGTEIVKWISLKVVPGSMSAGTGTVAVAATC